MPLPRPEPTQWLGEVHRDYFLSKSFNQRKGQTQQHTQQHQQQHQAQQHQHQQQQHQQQQQQKHLWPTWFRIFRNLSTVKITLKSNL